MIKWNQTYYLDILKLQQWFLSENYIISNFLNNLLTPQISLLQEEYLGKLTHLSETWQVGRTER